MSIYQTLNRANKYTYNPATYQILKYNIGDIVDISVNYLAELPEGVEYINTGIISEIRLGESLSYHIEEIGLWFSEDELVNTKG